MLRSVLRDKAPLAVACAAVAAAIAFSAPASARLGTALVLGKTMLLINGLPSTLGAQSFSAPHDRWFGVGWLTAYAVGVLYGWGGYLALAFFATLTAVLAMTLVERRCARRGLGPGAKALALAIAVLMSVGNLRVGNGVTDLFFAAAFLYVLESPGKAAWWGALALEVLWCNASPTGLIVPIIVEFLRRSPASIAFFFALLATPTAERLITHASAYLRIDGMNDISAWQPMRVSPVGFVGGFLPATILAGWVGLLRAGKGETGVTLCAMLLAQLNGYYLGVAGIIIGPIIATAFERFRRGDVELATSPTPAIPQKPSKKSRPALQPAAPRVRWSKAAFGFASLALAPALLAAGIAHARGVDAMDGAREANAAAETLFADGKPHRLYCADPAWCDAVLLHGDSAVRVFLDGRNVDYPDDVRHASDVIAFMDPDWRKDVDKWKIDAIEAPSAGLGGLLTVLPGWRCVRSTEHIRLFERRP